MSSTGARVHVLRLRIGMAVVAARRGIDPTEARVEGMHLAVVTCAIALIAFTFTPAMRRFGQYAMVVGASMLLLSASWTVTEQGWGTQYVIAPVILSFVLGAVAANKLEAAVIVGAENDHVVFAVRDTGRGVPQEQQALLFGKFMRLDSRATDRPYQRRAREGHGGSLHAAACDARGAASSRESLTTSMRNQ